MLLLSLPALPAADVIHLKDGTTIKVSKTWEEDGWVRFYLEDYEGIVITYNKDIIDRIETDDGRIVKRYSDDPPPETDTKAPAVKAQPDSAAAQRADAPQPDAPAAPAGQPPPQPQPAKLPPPPPPVKPADAPVIAPPTPPTSVAPAAVSNQTVPPPVAPVPSLQPPTPAAEPVRQPSAATAKPTTSAPPAAAAPAPVAPVVDEFSRYEGLLFYNPRRDYPYWSAPNAGHRTLKEAVSALAATCGRSPEWVQQNLGNTNDLAQIYRNLNREQVKKSTPTVNEVSAVNGLAFYDPRRQYKFHLNSKLRFRTLDEAVQALARQYERSPEWIKEHLGETNDVGEIHNNLSRAKAAEAN